MASIVCFYCDNHTQKEQPFCGRCGGRPRGETAVEQAIAGLMLSTRLIRERVWFGLEKEIAAVKALFESGNDVYVACAPALEWLVQEIPRVALEADILRVIEVARQVFSLVRRDAYADLRAQVIRLERFSNALRSTDADWGGRRSSPSRRKVSKWLAEQAELALMTMEQAFESIYETPEGWPCVARTVDAETWERVEWKVEVARAEEALEKKNYETARDLFTAVLGRETDCARALEGLAQVQNRLGQPGLAVDHYRAAILTGNAGPKAWNSLAWILATQGSPSEADLSEALWAARRAVAIAPRSPCWDTLAEVLSRQGDLTTAIAATRESIRLDPNRQDYRERMRTMCAALQPSALPSDEAMEATSPNGEPSEATLSQAEPSLAETPPPAVKKSEKEIFDDTDYDIDVNLSDADSDDKTIQLDAASDFELAKNSSASECFAMDEEDVDQNASSSMAPSALAEDEDQDDDGFDSAMVSERCEPAPPERADRRPSVMASADRRPTGMASAARRPAVMVGKRSTGSLLERMRDFVRGRRPVVISRPQRVDLAGQREFAEANVESKQTDVPGPVTDRVCFSLTAPARLEVGGSYALDVWAYLGNQRAEVMAMARQSQGSDNIQVKTKSGVAVTRGTVLTVHIAIPTLEVADPEDIICWEGEIGNATFPVSVPMQARPGPHAGTATFRVDQFPIAKLHFVLEVGAEAAAIVPLAARESRYKSAFASYASEDRDEVLGRLQGILKVLPDLELFLDVVSLRSGECWEERLSHEIARRDTLFLFWSLAASRSPWVEREWRTALGLRGVAGIDPIPLVSPEKVAPPTELAQHLHFNDWLLAFMRGRGGSHLGDSGRAFEQ
jgi:tetratricopeptide (TPR) repeat protein